MTGDGADSPLREARVRRKVKVEAGRETMKRIPRLRKSILWLELTVVGSVPKQRPEGGLKVEPVHLSPLSLREPINPL